MDLSFDPITPQDYTAVERMVLEFYAEGGDDAEDPFMTDSKVRKTIAQTLSHPDHLKIVVFKDGGEAIGYCILSAFWSNEYGGLVLIVDELYVVPSYRSSGVASQFITLLSEAREYVALQLEVFHENPRAFALYERLGFRIIDRKFMQKLL